MRFFGLRKVLAPAGPYHGRLAFDPDTDFHLSEDGRHVVTDDAGVSWRYATKDDPTHQARYHQRYAVIDTTANQAGPDPHHWEVQPDDAHYHGIVSDPDVVAVTITSHTDAWGNE